MSRLFGTDGVRGLANADLTPELALAVAASAARVLGARTAVVGRDTRASGEMLEAAVCAGLASAGVSVERLGVVPTPGVAFLTIGHADMGVMLSASHNPMPDNGVKLFGATGHKLPDGVEDAVEAGLAASWERPTGAGVGRVRDADGVAAYLGHLVSTGARLDGLSVVVDCANGAASEVAPAAYAALGASVTAIHAEPDGLNINEGCGSTHPESLVEAVRERGADLGVAHDGDADRCLLVTAAGDLVDGDQILAILAVARSAPAVVTTVMANLGLKRAMASHGVEVVETGVGDRYVLEAMRERGIALGGEQSGHVIVADHATTGDGVLTAIQVMSAMALAGRPLAELAAVMERLPQVLLNVRVADKAAALDAGAEAVREAEAALDEDGRVLLRPSGTEPVVRVMVEATSEDVARQWAERVAAAVAPG
ncbi:MAG TPA: phosphoglucosamine mutase [Frankiaceae bacterium]|nr:phosphoglucosamine mutase [Frankiaceae bacterium]